MDAKKLPAATAAGSLASPMCTSARLCSPLEALPSELLNLVLDSLVRSRCHSAGSCCRNSEPCCRSLRTSCASLHGSLGQKRGGVREVSSLLLASRSMCSLVRSLPSFAALHVTHFLVAKDIGLHSSGGPLGPLLPPKHTAAWIRSLYLRELPESPRMDGSAASTSMPMTPSVQADQTVEGYSALNSGLLQHFSGLLVLHLPHWFGDLEARVLPSLRSLKCLCLRGSNAGDSTLQLVAAVEGLEELDLSSTAVSSAGLEHLKGLRRLRLLNLSFCQAITDASGAHLQHLQALEELYLCGTLVSDETLMLLSALPRLRKLALEQCESISDMGLDIAERVLARNYSRSVAYRASRDWGRSFMEIMPTLA